MYKITVSGEQLPAGGWTSSAPRQPNPEDELPMLEVTISPRLGELAKHIGEPLTRYVVSGVPEELVEDPDHLPVDFNPPITMLDNINDDRTHLFIKPIDAVQLEDDLNLFGGRVADYLEQQGHVAEIIYPEIPGLDQPEASSQAFGMPDQRGPSPWS